MKIIVKFPTRNRTDKFFNVLDLYYEKAVVLDKLHFLITCDNDDTSMNNDEVKNRLNGYENLTVIYGNSKNKIHAVNKDLDKAPEYDIIILASDDMIPQIYGYDQIVRDKMKKCYPNTDGVLWFNDGYQKEKLNTLCILGKKYYDRFGYIYYPDYKSGWCDNEFMSVGNLLNRQTYFDQVIIKHEHPDYGFGRYDSGYHKNVSDLSWDKQLFYARESKNFDI
jgi:hypothetical protein